MSAPASWQALDLHDNAACVRVLRETTAAELVQELMGSKAAAKRVLAGGQLVRGGRPLEARETLAPGEEIDLLLRTQPAPATRAAKAGQPPAIVYRDRVLCAVDKPQGLLVHGDGSDADTLTARLAATLAAEGLPGLPQAVQRLDVETTGLVLFSLAEELQPVLDAQVAGHGMSKRYLAVVCGSLPGDDWLELDGPIARDRHDARKMRVGRTGKPSLTRVRTLARSGARSLVLVELMSGRRHQIRVHLAHAEHPIEGDALYGGRQTGEGLMLHAYEERLVHPVWRTPLTLRTGWPARFSRMGFDENAAGLHGV